MCINKLRDGFDENFNKLLTISEFLKEIRGLNYLSDSAKTKINMAVKEDGLVIKNKLISLVSDICQDVIENSIESEDKNDN